MSTKVYGQSDDLIEFEGDFRGEVSYWGTDEEDHKGVLIILSDGTLLQAKYGKNNKAIWGISLVRQGTLFLNIDQCCDENAKIYSDIAHFAFGIKWAYATGEWEEVS